MAHSMMTAMLLAATAAIALTLAAVPAASAAGQLDDLIVKDTDVPVIKLWKEAANGDYKTKWPMEMTSDFVFHTSSLTSNSGPDMHWNRQTTIEMASTLFHAGGHNNLHLMDTSKWDTQVGGPLSTTRLVAALTAGMGSIASGGPACTFAYTAEMTAHVNALHHYDLATDFCDHRHSPACNHFVRWVAHCQFNVPFGLNSNGDLQDFALNYTASAFTGNCDGQKAVTATNATLVINSTPKTGSNAIYENCNTLKNSKVQGSFYPTRTFITGEDGNSVQADGIHALFVSLPDGQQCGVWSPYSFTLHTIESGGKRVVDHYETQLEPGLAEQLTTSCHLSHDYEL